MHEDGQWQVRVSLETPESQKTPPKKRADLRDGVKKETYLGTSGTLFFVFKLKRIDKSTEMIKKVSIVSIVSIQYILVC